MFKSIKRATHVVVLTATLALAAGVPAFAVDKIDCNWLGSNCRGFWDHGYNSTSVYSNYKHLDNRHGASSYGTTSGGVRKESDSGCKAANVWANSSLSNVVSNRQAFYRDC